MKRASIQFNPEILERVVVPALEEKLRIATQRRDREQAEIDQITAQLKEIRKTVDAIPVAEPLAPPQKSLTGKIKRGEADRLIKEFLQNRNGSGVSVKAIVETTGIGRSTVDRALERLLTLEWIDRAPDGRWRWKNERERTG